MIKNIFSMENSGLYDSEIPESSVRQAIYYIPNQNSGFLVQNEDDELEATIDDLKICQKDLSNLVKLELNRPFLPRTYVNRKNKELKQNAYKKSTISFSIQNRCIIQANFFSIEPVSNLFAFIRSILVDSSIKFNLIFIRSKIIEDKLKNLLEADIAPATRLMINFFETTSLPNDLLSLLNLNTLKQVNENGAELERRNWLLDNSTFQSFESMLCINDIQLRASEKRAAEFVFGCKSKFSNNSENSFASNSATDTNSTIPKWFKKI